VLFYSEEDKREANALLSSLQNSDFGIIVPGCSVAGTTKRWGIANYIELSNQWLNSGKVNQIVILGSKDEADVCASVSDGIGQQALNLCGKTALTHILPLVSKAKGVVSNDTGLAHIAAAAAVPMVVICGPTLSVRVKPLGDHVKALQVDPNCFSTKPSKECMDSLKPDVVLQKLLSI
jgi:heptosyltransferase-2